MKTKILVVGDTHISTFKDLSNEMVQYIKESNWIIHVGDFTSPNIVQRFKDLKHDYFKGVYGNSDPLIIRKSLPHKDIIEIKSKRFGIIHPGFGGPETFLKKRIIKEFRDHDVDVIAYGHTHEAEIEWVGKTLLVNPGRGYIDDFSYRKPASIALITIDTEISAVIKEIKY